MRPRGWHLEEAHFLVDGERMSGSLFDFGLYMFHSAKISLAAGQGPYFYLPKMESHLEARCALHLHCIQAAGWKNPLALHPLMIIICINSLPCSPACLSC